MVRPLSLGEGRAAQSRQVRPEEALGPGLGHCLGGWFGYAGVPATLSVRALVLATTHISIMTWLGFGIGLGSGLGSVLGLGLGFGIATVTMQKMRQLMPSSRTWMVICSNGAVGGASARR